MIRRVVPSIVGLAAMLASARAPAQQQASWTGTIRCDIQSDAVGYSHREIQTWTLTGAVPTKQGSSTLHQATWSVSGQGSHDRTRSPTRRLARWTVTVPNTSSPVTAPIAFTQHAVGDRFDVVKWHAQLTAAGGYTGTDQISQGGAPQPATRLSATVYEWQFPKIEADLSQSELTGTNTSTARAIVGPLQPDDAKVTVACSWSLSRGSASSSSSTSPVPNQRPVPSTVTDPRPDISSRLSTRPSASAPPPSAAPAPASTSTSIAPPTMPQSASTPPSPSSTSATGGSGPVGIEIYPYFVSDPTVPNVSWWPPNGTARYVLGVDNTQPYNGSGAADGTVLAIPAVPGLSKTGVACIAAGGAQCPAGLTISQLESGVAIPRLPAFGTVRIAFEGKVTGALGGNITVTATVKGPPNTRDTTPLDDTVSKTHAILTPSMDTAPELPVTAASAGGAPAVASGPTLAACRLAGPVITTPTASPTGAVLSWAHINGGRYTVSRDDVGVVTSSALTAALFPSVVTFAHSAPTYSNRTYRYTVVAEYGGGCGTSSIEVTAHPPAQVWAQAHQRPNSTLVDITWQGVLGGGAPPSRGGGVRVFGPGMPAVGYQQSPYDCATNVNGLYMCTHTIGLAPGTHTWNVVPYWETEAGVMMDVNSGTRVTLTVK